MQAFETRKTKLSHAVQAAGGTVALKKHTISNLFRYATQEKPASRIRLDGFNRVLGMDVARRTLNVEGFATYETIVDATLPHGLLPTVTPELKHITLGGATVGIGIESTCFRHGFVHDGLRQAEVLLPGGDIVICEAEGPHADLFAALPNSYGTLGYILRVVIDLIPAGPYVHLTSKRHDRLPEFFDAMQTATEDAAVDFIEGLIFSRDEQYLMSASFADEIPARDDILRRDIFYQLIRRKTDIYLSTREYIFRYDPEWFWNIPEGTVFRWFRKYAPRSMRNTGFYTRYAATKAAVCRRLPGRTERREPLIQDWQVPWELGLELTELALDNVDLEDRPWAAVPIRTPASPTLYPIEADTLYFNLGCYAQVKRQPDHGDYYATRLLDEKCFELDGIKMLYSSTFLPNDRFDAIYNGAEYARLKAKYDPDLRVRTLYEKATSGTA